MVLLEFELPSKFVELIMGCVCTVNYSLLVNGGLVPSFQAQRGLRQGDSMSPYLFTLTMEYLNKALKKLQTIRDFNYHPKCEKLNLVHVCFADDLIMCCRTDKHSLKLIIECVEHFSTVSSLKANMKKSCLYIAGVQPNVREEILIEFQFSLLEMPFKYLGVPLSASKLTISQCLPLVEKIAARVKCWVASVGQ